MYIYKVSIISFYEIEYYILKVLFNEIKLFSFHETLLYVAVENGNPEIVKFVLENEQIDINTASVKK